MNTFWLISDTKNGQKRILAYFADTNFRQRFLDSIALTYSAYASPKITLAQGVREIIATVQYVPCFDGPEVLAAVTDTIKAERMDLVFDVVHL